MGDRTCKKHRCAERRWAGGSDGSGGESPITYVFTQLFVKENLSGAAVIAENPDVFDPKKYNAAGRKEVKKYVMQKIMVVGSNGKAK